MDVRVPKPEYEQGEGNRRKGRVMICTVGDFIEVLQQHDPNRPLGILIADGDEWDAMAEVHDGWVALPEAVIVQGGRVLIVCDQALIQRG